MAVAPDLFGFCRTSGQFRPLSQLAFLSLDLRYATERNFCRRNLYLGEREAWLHLEATEALERSAQDLSRRHPGWKFRIYDATRPLSVQKQLFAAVAGTPREAYVSDPERGSLHCYGMAVDLGLEDADGRELDLGTPFDTFDLLAQPQLERTFFEQGRLLSRQMNLRQALRVCMNSGGFVQNPLEWWHFDLRPLEEVRGKYPLVEGH